jgi:hypothetical protein
MRALSNMIDVITNHRCAVMEDTLSAPRCAMNGRIDSGCWSTLASGIHDIA